MTRRDIAREIADIYARALLDLADERGLSEKVGAEMGGIAELIGREDEFRMFLHTPTIADAVKADFLRRVFAGKVTDLMMDFLMVVARHGRLGLLVEMAERYHRLFRARQGFVDVDLTTAVQLDEQQLERISSAISQVLQKRVLLRPRVEPKVLGGMAVQIGDRLIDATLVSRLRSLRRRLFERATELRSLQAIV